MSFRTSRTLPIVARMLVAGLCLHAASGASLRITVTDPHPGRTQPVPVSLELDLPADLRAAARGGQLQLSPLDPAQRTPLPGQFEPAMPASARGTLRWLLPPAAGKTSQWRLEKRPVPVQTSLRAWKDTATGQWDVSDGGRPVLKYNYQTNAPGTILEGISADNRKYARARGDYIHPLYGAGGEVLTKDWSVDHPHHRGIYWAWPEVDFRGERGDLHALQRVFARPTGRCSATAGPVFARIEAENLWRWEDRDPIVRETATIRVWSGGPAGHLLDLEFRFVALEDSVALARRQTKLYGGLNVRLAAVKDQLITLHTDAADHAPRRAWADLSGVFNGSEKVTGLAIAQHPANPEYPGDWIQYPEINWFQPTFPSADTRYALKKDAPLVLRYRLWIHPDRAEEAGLVELWQTHANPPEAALQF